MESYTDAVACAIRHMPVDPERRNVLVTHQFVTGAEGCSLETKSLLWNCQADRRFQRRCGFSLFGLYCFSFLEYLCFFACIFFVNTVGPSGGM